MAEANNQSPLENNPEDSSLAALEAAVHGEAKEEDLRALYEKMRPGVPFDEFKARLGKPVLVDEGKEPEVIELDAMETEARRKIAEIHRSIEEQSSDGRLAA